MKEIIGNLFGFLYTLSMGDYIFFFFTFILILLFVYMIFLLKKIDSEEIDNIEVIKDRIEKEYKPTKINLTDYENEQEENAIISYEELLKNKEKMSISYDEDYTSDTEEINIKKISFQETNLKEENKTELNVKLMNYDKEEAFLTALKKLQNNLG